MAKNTTDLVIAVAYYWTLRNLKVDNFEEHKYTTFEWDKLDIENMKKYMIIAFQVGS